MDEQPTTDDNPDFGPRGYLPDRASRRARKIVLRAPMGIQWVIGAITVGVGLVIAAVLTFGGDGAPEAPYVLVESTGASPVFGEDVQLTVIDSADFDDPILVVSEGRPRVLRLDREPAPVFCDASGLLEAPDGASWRVTGRGLGGVPSLAEHPSVVFEGSLYADPTTTIAAPAPSEDDIEQQCGGAEAPTPTP